jgi:hypothetical protein
MRRCRTLIGLLAAAVAPGCTLIANGARNLCNEPALAIEECRFKYKARSLAREAWGKHTDYESASADFRDGYVDGYADYLGAGRTTDPPPPPPKRYMEQTYQTPESLRAVEDYFAGFHAGAVDAQSSGQRGLMVVPVVFPLPADSWSMPATIVSPAAPVEPLPPPREIPKTTSLPRRETSS